MIRFHAHVVHGSGVFGQLAGIPQMASYVWAQASSGLYVRLGRHFDFLGELRYAVTSDANVFLYTLGFGARF